MAVVTWRRSAGLTLIEIMVVLMMIGLTSTLITGVINSGRSSDQEVDRLALALEMAAERARVRGSPIRFDRLPQGYRFSRLDTAGNWQPVTDDPLLAEHGLPSDLTWLRLNRDGQDIAGGLVFGGDVALYTLEVGSRAGAIRLVGHASGSLQKIVPGGPA